jgi:hypothetical protein
MNSFMENDRGAASAGRTCRRSLLARRAQRMVTGGGVAIGRPGIGQRLARVLAGALGLTAVISGVFAAVPAGASASVNLDGSFSAVVVKPGFAGLCPSGVADECGTMVLAGLGGADWAYLFGPAFAPDGRCFDVDGTLTITLHSDGSMISGPLAGIFCPDPSGTGHQHAGAISYGNPFTENDSIALTGGTGQFAGLTGTASFRTFSAGARFTGTLEGTLSG